LVIFSGELVWINVMRRATAEWIAQQTAKAFPWNEAPRYLIRNQDGVYAVAVTRRFRAISISGLADCARIAMAE